MGRQIQPFYYYLNPPNYYTFRWHYKTTWDRSRRLVKSHRFTPSRHKIKKNKEFSHKECIENKFQLQNCNIFFLNDNLNWFLNPQCPRTDLNKRFLPRPKTNTAWKLIPHRSKISKNWNPPLYRFYKLISTNTKTALLSKIVPNVQDFNSCWY